MTAPETLTPDGVEAVIGEARAHVERDAWLSRGTRRTLGVLLDEIDRLRALPVLRTCGECGWQRHYHIPGSGMEMHCGHGHATRQDRLTEDAAPPSWCPLRGDDR